jgi:hypothetical protein
MKRTPPLKIMIIRNFTTGTPQPGLARGDNADRRLAVPRPGAALGPLISFVAIVRL